MSAITPGEALQVQIDTLAAWFDENDELLTIVDGLGVKWTAARARYPRLVKHAPAEINAVFTLLDQLVEHQRATMTEATT